MNLLPHIHDLRVSLPPRLSDRPQVHHRDLPRRLYCAPRHGVALHLSLNTMPQGGVPHQDLAPLNSSWQDRCNFPRPYRLHRKSLALTASPALEQQRADRAPPIGAARQGSLLLPTLFAHAPELGSDMPATFQFQFPPAPSSGGDR